MRKPRTLKRIPRRGLYAGIKKTNYKHQIYIGGDYYGDSAQIHLFADEVEALSKWLAQVSKYLQTKKRERKSGDRK